MYYFRWICLLCCTVNFFFKFCTSHMCQFKLQLYSNLDFFLFWSNHRNKKKLSNDNHQFRNNEIKNSTNNFFVCVWNNDDFYWIDYCWKRFVLFKKTKYSKYHIWCFIWLFLWKSNHDCKLKNVISIKTIFYKINLQCRSTKNEIFESISFNSKKIWNCDVHAKIFYWKFRQTNQWILFFFSLFIFINGFDLYKNMYHTLINMYLIFINFFFKKRIRRFNVFF